MFLLWSPLLTLYSVRIHMLKIMQQLYFENILSFGLGLHLSRLYHSRVTYTWTGRKCTCDTGTGRGEQSTNRSYHTHTVAFN